METNNNQLNMDKVAEAVSMNRPGVSQGAQGIQTGTLQSHKKAIILICLLVVVIGVLTFFFKEKIFKNIDSGIPETPQEAIDQAFKEGYKTDYTYTEADMTRTSVEMQKASNALSKKKQATPAQKKALLDRINN